MRPRNDIKTPSPTARAILELCDQSGLPDGWITHQAGVGMNFLGRLRNGAAYDFPGLERVARVLGYRIQPEPLPTEELTEADQAMAAEREAAKKIRPMHRTEVPPALRADWRILKEKRFTNREAAAILGIGAAA